MRYKCYLRTPIGMLGIEEEDGAVTALYLKEECLSEGCADENQENQISESVLLRKVSAQLTEYFEGRRKEFDIPINPQGTEFQKKVWKTLCDIPYGETRTYGDIAVQIGNSKATRAVGGANNKNPIMLLIPCHRVIGADGSLTGFGCGLNVKECLLNLEKNGSMMQTE